MQKILTSSTLRYNIKGRLRALPQSQASHIRDKVVTEMKVDESTFYRWIAVKKTDFRDIPGAALRLFSIYLKEPIESLFN